MTRSTAAAPAAPTVRRSSEPADVRRLRPRSSSAMPDFSGLRVAVVHDWLVTYAGSERVLEQVLRLFPQAVVFTLLDFLPEEDRAWLEGHEIRTSFMQRIPFAGRVYRSLLPIMPLAVEQLDVSAFDLVISSSHAVAKGIITGPDQLHVCYCHSPIRYAWDLQHQYLRESNLHRGARSWPARWLLHRIRMWDARTANGVDAFIANSQFVARRLEKVYRRTSTVIHPPVNSSAFTPGPAKEDYFLAGSRMVPYKRMPLIVEAFARMPDRRLVVIGDGPDMDRVRDLAGDNVEVLGYQGSARLREYMQRARAFVFAAQEDFGIMPVEAQACGTPVIAYGSGGAAETVRDGVTGIHFHEQTVEAIVDAVHRFEEQSFRAETLRAHAETFSQENFRRNIATFVGDLAVARGLLRSG